MTHWDMKSSFPNAAATPQHHPQCHTRGHSQPVTEPQTYSFRAAGVLRLNRESDNHKLNLTTILSEPATEYQLICEYCGEKARPPLDLAWRQSSPDFCCSQRQQLYQTLLKQRCFLVKRYLRTSGHGKLTSDEEKPEEEMEKPLVHSKEIEDHNMFQMELPAGLGVQTEMSVYMDDLIHLPEVETDATTSAVLHFRLSSVTGNEDWAVNSCDTPEECLKEKVEVLLPFCDHKQIKFGICHHQEGAGFLQKYYSDGMTFLTLFPDGSAQVFYPSGLLALIVVVTERNGRVCIVYDDINALSQPVRGVFQSDGRAACYHSNGNIWLALNRSGGQCLNETGDRVCRWRWGGQTLTPLQPVFLSLNKTVGIRVLGNKQVFVSFLAGGQQAKFSVGTCCFQCEYKPASGPSVLKEELFALAAKIRAHLAIQHLHQYLKTPSLSRLPKTTMAPHLCIIAQRILDVCADMTMSDSDRDFIQRCLKDC